MWRLARGPVEKLEWWTGRDWSFDKEKARIYWVRDQAVQERPQEARIFYFGPLARVHVGETVQ